MHKPFPCLFFLFVIGVFCNLSQGFSQTPINISIKGRVVGKDPNDYLYQIMVVNKRSKTGTFANADASFHIQALKSDTILFSASGYTIKKVCFNDSSYMQEYNVTIRLHKLNYYLKEVDIYPVKKLDEVQKSIDQLGVRNTNTYKNVDAMSSPITFLYERFSRFEQSKRKVAELENEDRRKEVLKDLFRVYIKYDIINLSNDDFDDFIVYCNLSDEFIKSASKYDLVMAIKNRYELFERNKRR